MAFQPKKILVPLAVEEKDELELAEAAMAAAVDLAKAFSAELLLMHAAPPPVPIVGPDLSGETYKALKSVLEARVEEAEKKLSGFVKQAEDGGVSARTVVSSEPDGIAQVIVQCAEKEGADMIAMCSHGRMGIKRLLLGSAAERVAHLAQIPVLLLKGQ
jgi:nucleotide-binding universal stress UspA family protein